VLRSRIILHHFDADPDADPNPAFYFNPDPLWKKVKKLQYMSLEKMPIEIR
jgi:hypothetical protein